LTRFDNRNGKPPKIEDGVITRWGWMVKGVEYFHLGKYTDIGFGCYIRADKDAEVTIGDYVQLGGGVKVYAVNTIDNSRGHIFIQKKAKIGANSVILPGSFIGENSIVGALSLVKGVVPAHEVWVGAPARPLKLNRERKLGGE